MISTKKVLFKIWVLKLVIIGFHKPRDNFPFSTVRMPHLCRNIPSKIFYFTFRVEILRVARTTNVIKLGIFLKLSLAELRTRV